MLDLALHLRIVGICLLILIFLNTLLPKYFQWRSELSKVSLVTRQVFISHALFICLILLMMAILSLFFAPLLLEGTPLAQLTLAGLAIFWTLRLAAQWFLYSPKLWRGNRFNTAMHILFSGVWFYFAAVYTFALLYKRR